MKKFTALLASELRESLRHPNREIIPALLFALFTYFGVNLGIHHMIPQIGGESSILWMLPGMIIFFTALMAYVDANRKILNSLETGYLQHLRSTATSPWLLVLVFILDAAIVSFVKAVIILLIYAILFIQIGSPGTWTGILLLAFLAGIFWGGLGVSIALMRKESLANSQIIASVIIPIFAVTGLIFPVAYYPSHLEATVLILPSTQAFEMGRALMGVTSYQGWMLTALLGWAALSLCVAVFLLFREDRR